ncbi:MAG: Single-stranded DNA-binding protein [Microgenomates group bacterium GW2011_GWA2_37_6]|nr:MAG: Single-stranded DNA-binding protein [Microgenomates group bacterium GW2011_GWA2_37_6]
MARSLNRVQLIGNLTRDPELRYTPAGTAVCSFGIATNRSWTTESGEKRDEADFHRIVAWNKLAELCSQFLTKGKKVYVEGRLTTRNWNAQDGTQKSTTEVIISDMILLDSSGIRSASSGQGRSESSSPAKTESEPAEKAEEPEENQEKKAKPASSKAKKPSSAEASEGQGKTEEEKKEEVKASSDEEVAPDDIPF